jgi:hypothetical protein
MKQKQYSPQSIAEMGLMLYAANEGFLKDIEVNKIGDFERALLSFMRARTRRVDEPYRATGDYNDEIDATTSRPRSRSSKPPRPGNLRTTSVMAAGKRNYAPRSRASSSTQKITSAMEMVAASKMRKAQDRMRAGQALRNADPLSNRPYCQRSAGVPAHVYAAAGREARRLTSLYPPIVDCAAA